MEEYSLIWKDAYDETAKYDLPPAGREAVADRVLDAHIATRGTPSSGGAPAPGPAPGTGQCIQTITPNQTVSGQWPSGCDSKVSGRGHAHYYQFTLTQDAEVTVLLESQDVETVLYLREGAGATSVDYMDSNDGESEYNYRRATIETSLAAATYTIEVTTYNVGETGSFTLTVSSVAAVAPAPTRTPGVVTISDIDGYTSEFRIEIFVSSIGTNLSMSRWNVFTVDGVKVRLDSDGNLTTKGFSLSLADRYSWACNPVNGSAGENRSYASEEYNIGLPKTDLDSAPLFNHSDGRWVSRICNGQATAPSSSFSTTWTKKFSLP